MGTETYRRVHADLEAREAQGIKTYGATLRSDTPVDLLTYAYEEALDKAVYLRAEIDRRNEVVAKVQAFKDKIGREIDLCSYGDRPQSPAVATLRVDLLLAEVLDLLKPLAAGK